jgi:hypothetical protein
MNQAHCDQVTPECGRISSFQAAMWLALAVILTGLGAQPALAQSLNWEGQDGVFITPLAYSLPTGDARLSIPVVSYHFGVDSHGNLYATLMHIGEVVRLNDKGSYDHIAWVPSKEESGKMRSIGGQHLGTCVVRAFNAPVDAGRRKRNLNPTGSIQCSPGGRDWHL